MRGDVGLSAGGRLGAADVLTAARCAIPAHRPLNSDVLDGIEFEFEEPGDARAGAPVGGLDDGEEPWQETN